MKRNCALRLARKPVFQRHTGLSWTSGAGAQQGIPSQRDETNQNEGSCCLWPRRPGRGEPLSCCWWQIKTLSIPSVSRCTWKSDFYWCVWGKKITFYLCEGISVCPISHRRRRHFQEVHHMAGGRKKWKKKKKNGSRERISGVLWGECTAALKYHMTVPRRLQSWDFSLSWKRKITSLSSKKLTSITGRFSYLAYRAAKPVGGCRKRSPHSR